MTATGGISAEASSSWLSLFSNLCAPLGSCLDGKPRRSKSSSLTATSISWPLGRSSDQDLLISEDDEKHASQVVYDQPAFQPRPTTATPQYSVYAASDTEGTPKKSFASARTTRSLKKRFRSDGSARRPHISGPSEFRHVNSSTFNFPASALAPNPAPTTAAPSFPQARVNRPARPLSFRPLELSIYMSDNRMSPILPHFEFPGAGLIATPEPAHLVDRLGDDHQLIRQRSSPSMSFHLPRQVAQGSIHSKSGDAEAPGIPPKAASRARAYTSPDIDSIKSRVASAMIEVEKLQRQINDVVERQSLYMSSRPSTAYSMAENLSALEPMPSIPALPPAAPSFAERLNVEFDRPKTAPIDSPASIAHQSQQSLDEKTGESTTTRRRQDGISPLPPPLPLVLRPPLRKKKSFSRVSTWLFPNGEHNRGLSLDSVTNLPRPVKGTEGFYQCVPAGSTSGRRSFESVGTVSTWETEEEDEQRTVPTSWSPGSTPVTKQEPSIERTATFGRTHASRSGKLTFGDDI